MEGSPASPVPAGRSVLRALFAKTRTLFGLRLLLAAIAGCVLRRLSQERNVTGLGWMLLDRLGLLRAVKSSNAPSFTRSLQFPPAEDTDGPEEPSDQKVQETSAQTPTFERSEQASIPEHSETVHLATEAKPLKEQEHNRSGALTRAKLDTQPPLPSMANGVASTLPAMRSLTIKMLEPASAKGEGQFYWASAKNAKAAKLFALQDMTSAATVSQVKERVAVQTGIPAASLQLLLFGCKLKDARTLRSYGIDNVNDPLIHVLPLVTASA